MVGTSAVEECILVLQGGGALGAYQAGVYEMLAERGAAPEWVAGISIGAINAAIIAGNPPQQRVERLREFWNTVTLPTAFPAAVDQAPVEWRRTVNEVNAGLGAVFGLPGFFIPRLPPAPLQPRGTPAALSYYDTQPLRQTLERLVDFDRLNSGEVRLSVGAVNVRSGNFRYFDSAREKLDARHIMASGALPPGFPQVDIDGEWYWDGGLVSNTPLQYVLDHPGDRGRLVFQVDLFVAEGPLPEDLMQVAEREKDIRFSSRTRLNTANCLDIHVLAQAATRLASRLPAELADDPDVQLLKSAGRVPALTVVHLIHRRKRDETQSKDYEFSRASMAAHWRAGREDVERTLGHADWQGRKPPRQGAASFDIGRGDHQQCLKEHK
jgi:NTE family protein